ncbi:GAF domain-like protein [Mycena galericulata]|nr:GAF domain-like protein [Mycena galericulata]
MPHADSALVPETITSKAEFWSHVYSQLDLLLDSQQRNWITSLSNASSLIYNSLLAFPPHFGNGQRAVNWCGFYLDSQLFPQPTARRGENGSHAASERLLLARGVCADSFLQRRTIVVPDVETYPGHIACDGETRSEVVCPLILRSEEHNVRVLGVLDLDCLVVEGFDDEDKVGLEKIADLLVKACDW